MGIAIALCLALSINGERDPGLPPFLADASAVYGCWCHLSMLVLFMDAIPTFAGEMLILMGAMITCTGAMLICVHAKLPFMDTCLIIIGPVLASVVVMPPIMDAKLTSTAATLLFTDANRALLLRPPPLRPGQGHVPPIVLRA
eukprot:848270-Rhodomonas_salina.1